MAGNPLGVKITWLWSPVYKGLEIAWRYDTARQAGVFLGITHKEWKERGW